MKPPSFKFEPPAPRKPLREMSEMSEDALRNLHFPKGKWNLRTIHHDSNYRIMVELHNSSEDYLLPDKFNSLEEGALAMMYLAWTLTNPPN